MSDLKSFEREENEGAKVGNLSRIAVSGLSRGLGRKYEVTGVESRESESEIDSRYFAVKFRDILKF